MFLDDGRASHAAWCDAEMSAMTPDKKLHRLQARLDDLLAGNVESWEDEQPTFAAFDSTDMRRATALATLWMKIADETGGLDGLERAVDHMYDNFHCFPLGMTEHAAKIFLTHYAPAREHLIMRSLEERQPGLVQPSPRKEVRRAVAQYRVA